MEWGKRLVDIEEFESGVRAEFTDGSGILGGALVGADGSRSMVRQFL